MPKTIRKAPSACPPVRRGGRDGLPPKAFGRAPCRSSPTRAWPVPLVRACRGAPVAGKPLPPKTVLRRGQGGLRHTAHSEPLPSPRRNRNLPNFDSPALNGRASPYTINGATMRPWRGDPPAAAHPLAPGLSRLSRACRGGPVAGSLPRESRSHTVPSHAKGDDALQVIVVQQQQR